MRVVVTGAGAVGRHLAADLADRGHDVTLIEQNLDVVEKAREWAPKVNVLLGDACEPWVLERAELSKADVVVAATGDDEDNLVTSLLAKQEFAVPRVLARVNHPKNEWLFTDQWGVDAAVSPPHILTAMVEEAVTVGDLVRLIRLEGGRISIVEMTLPDASPSVGRPLYELRLPPDSAVVAILRDGHVVIPQPETRLLARRRGGGAVVADVGVRAADRDRRRRHGGRHAADAWGDRRRRPVSWSSPADPAYAELQPRVDHLRRAPLVPHHALHDHARPEREPLDAPAPHEHQHGLTRPVGHERLQRLLALHREDREPLHHARDPHALPRRRPRRSGRCRGSAPTTS